MLHWKPLPVAASGPTIVTFGDVATLVVGVLATILGEDPDPSERVTIRRSRDATCVPGGR
jgi:hypothetical protein